MTFVVSNNNVNSLQSGPDAVKIPIFRYSNTLMRKTLIISLFIITLSALNGCSSQSAAADAMAEEMCAAIEVIQLDDPMSMLDAADKMMKISEKKEAYGKVTEAQLKKAMQDTCPEGWEKFEGLRSK